MSAPAESPHLLPAGVRRWVLVAVIVLLALATAGIIWRGPALLLDLAAIAAWCF